MINETRKKIDEALERKGIFIHILKDSLRALLSIRDRFDSLITTVRSIKLDIPKHFDVTVDNFPQIDKEIRVTNLEDIKIPEVKIPSVVKVSNLEDIKPAVVNIPDKVEVKNLKDIKIPQTRIPAFPKFPKFDIAKPLKSQTKKIVDELKKIKLPTQAKDAVAVRLSNGEEFYEAVTQVMGGGNVVNIPKVTLEGGRQAIPVVNPDGSEISGGGGAGGDVNIDEWGGTATTLGQKTMAASVPVVVASNQSAIPISASSLPLPTGAATAANQQTDALTDAELRATAVPVSAASLPLPTGAATSANQSTIIGHVDGIEGLLTTIDTDTGAMVTDLAAIEVLLTTIETNQLPDGHNVTIDNPGDIGGGVQYTEGDTDASITGTAIMMEVASDTLQPVQGTVAGGLLVNLGGNNDVTVTGTVDLGAVDNAVLDTIDAVLDTIKVDTEAIETAVEAIQAGQLADGHNVTIDNASIPVTGTFWQATQPVSGTVTANLSATDNTVLDNIDTSTAGILADTAAIQTAVETIDNAISGNEMQVDVVAALPAGTNNIGKVDHAITSIGHGVKTVTTAGTDLALASTTACKKVAIQAQTDNTGVIAVGAAGVDAAVATGTGVLLEPGDTLVMQIDDLADIFIDATVSGEGVRYTYWN